VAPSGSSPVRNPRQPRELAASDAGVEAGSAEGIRLAVAAAAWAEIAVVGSRSVRTGAVGVVAAAVAEGEFLEAGRALSAGRAAVVEAAVARRVLG